MIETLPAVSAEREKPSALILSDDEINHALQRGSGFEGGKLRIATFYVSHPTPKAAQDFLKEEYGIGGHSHTYLSGSGGFVDYDSKGIRFSGKGYSEQTRLCWLIISTLLSAASHVAKPLQKRICFTGYLCITYSAYDLSKKCVNAVHIAVCYIVRHTLYAALTVSRNVTVSVGVVVIHKCFDVTGKHIGAVIILLITAALSAVVALIVHLLDLINSRFVAGNIRNVYCDRSRAALYHAAVPNAVRFKLPGDVLSVFVVQSLVILELPPAAKLIVWRVADDVVISLLIATLLREISLIVAIIKLLISQISYPSYFIEIKFCRILKFT